MNIRPDTVPDPTLPELLRTQQEILTRLGGTVPPAPQTGFGFPGDSTLRQLLSVQKQLLSRVQQLPTGPDSSLSAAGQAADAKATGDALAALQDSLAELTALVSGTVADFGSFAQIAAVVRDGKQALNFRVGDQLIPTWSEGGSTYSDPFNVVELECRPELENGATVHGMLLQQHYTNVSACPYDAQEALYDADEGLAPGTYHFTVAGNTWLPSENGKVYQFTLSVALPAGGQLVFGNSSGHNQTLAGQTLKSYAGPADFSPMESVLLTEGSDGTDLGITDGNGLLNHIKCAFRGSVRWKTSLLRQYLNSAAPAGQWWSKQDRWDRASPFISTCAGYMAGFGADFLSALRPVRVQTARDSFRHGGGTDISYDTFFPVSLQQLNAVPSAPDTEGTALPYWQNIAASVSAGGLDSLGRFRHATPYPILRAYALENHNTARNQFLRSTVVSTSSVWFVQSTGQLTTVSPIDTGYYCAPACVIC